MTDNFDDLFGSDEFDGFDDLSDFDDLGDLGNMPDFGGDNVPDLSGDAPDLRGELGIDMGDASDDLGDLPDFSGTAATDFGLATEDPELQEAFQAQSSGGGRIGRPFMLAMIVIVLSIICIAAMAVIYALTQDPGLSEAEELNTSIPLTNTAIYIAHIQTSDALDMMGTATQFSLATSVAEATQTRIDQMTQEANMTATAIASATAAAEATAAQELANVEATRAAEVAATETAEANTLSGQLTTMDGVPIANATIRLYKDDGSGNPPAGGGSTGGGTTGGNNGSSSDDNPVVGPAQPITYLGQESGTLTAGQADAWVFDGAANDVVLINAIAVDTLQTDLYLQLVDAAGTVLAEDDNTGTDTNPAILNFTLPTAGEYTIQVSSLSGGGDYTLSLSRGLTIPDTPVPVEPTEKPAPTLDPADQVDPLGEPTQETNDTNASVPNQSGIMLMSNTRPNGREVLRQDGDDPIGEITTDEDGNFDFGALDPGIYWIEVPYDQLPADQQALVPPGTSMFMRVEVPSGTTSFQLMPPDIMLTPTPTEEPTMDPFFLTATQFALELTASVPAPTLDPDATIEIVTITPSTEPGAEDTSDLPTEIPDAGFFDDIGGSDNGGMSGTSGLTVIAIAAAGMVAVVFIARRLRNAG